MATSDSPLSVPNVTLAVARGASAPPPEPGAAPSISSFSGTFAQGNTITLSGSFTAERNGQIGFLRGDPSKDGQTVSELKDFSGGYDPSGDYKHHAAKAFGPGASMLATNEDGTSVKADNSCFFLGEDRPEVFFSMELQLDISMLPSTGVAPQLKGSRAVSGNSHKTSPQMQFQLRSTIGEDAMYYTGGNWDDQYEVKIRDPDTDETWGRTSISAGESSLHLEWYRLIMYAKYPSSPTATDGRRFAAIIEHKGDRRVKILRDYIDGPTNQNPINSWLAPAVHGDPTSGTDPRSFSLVALPWYGLGTTGIKIWADHFYVNGTPERVELGNAPVMDDCTKLVVQKQLSRTNGQIEFECQEGNFSPSDDVYAFVVNSDTQYTAGALIRAGA